MPGTWPAQLRCCTEPGTAGQDQKLWALQRVRVLWVPGTGARVGVQAGHTVGQPDAPHVRVPGAGGGTEGTQGSGHAAGAQCQGGEQVGTLQGGLRCRRQACRTSVQISEEMTR